jgi:aspartyl/asparaginyl-tRNA synthetase
MTEPPPTTQPSKNALKKAAKDAEKAKKKAEHARLREEELQLRQRQEAASDFAAASYGQQPSTVADPHREWIQLTKIGESEDRLVVFRCAIENARIQSTKLAFLVAGQALQSIQLVVAEDGENVSRPMVKFAGDIPSESICVVHGMVKRTTEKIKSATIQDFEIHVRKIYIVSKAHTPLPLQPADSERALPSETDKETGKEDVNSPLVSLNTRLNNRVLDLRAKINHCIFILKDGVDSLFQEFLRSRGFMRIHTPKIIGAPSEGIATS